MDFHGRWLAALEELQFDNNLKLLGLRPFSGFMVFSASVILSPDASR
jgi:hypothetical protein